MPSQAALRRRPRRRLRRIGVLGTGYMGLATAVAFAHKGFQVFAYDADPRVRAALRAGRSPYHEPGLGALVRAETRRGRFALVDSVEQLADRGEILFVCLPTPSRARGTIDLAPVREGVTDLGRALRETRGYRLVVVKSTVVPGTTERVVEPLLRRRSGKGPRELGVAFNPEFLSEGRMVADTLRPERIVIGGSDRRAAAELEEVYRGFGAPVFVLTLSAAELVKYGSNSFLALKVSFANEVGRLAERLGCDVDAVMAAVGADRRIGPQFLRAGPGFGGSCFGKDLRAIAARARELGLPFRSAEAALTINAEQMAHVLALVRGTYRTLRRRTVTVLGLSFKAGTDDVRESRAFPLVAALLEDGANVRVHDPVALSNFRREWARGGHRDGRRVAYCGSIESALRGSDLAVLQTDWPRYARWTPRWSGLMRAPTVVDLRREISPRVARRAGLRLVPLGVGLPRSVGLQDGAAPAVRGSPSRRGGPRGRRR